MGEDASILTTAHIFQMGWSPTPPTMVPHQLGIFPEPTHPFGADGGIAPARRGRVPHHSQAGAWWGLVEAERTVTWRVGRPGYGDVGLFKGRLTLLGFVLKGLIFIMWWYTCYGWLVFAKESRIHWGANGWVFRKTEDCLEVGAFVNDKGDVLPVTGLIFVNFQQDVDPFWSHGALLLMDNPP